MEFEKAVRLLEKYDAEVPVLASTERLGEPRRFVLIKTFAEAPAGRKPKPARGPRR